MEEELYLTTILKKLVVQHGPSCEESVVLDFIEKELNAIDKSLVIKRDEIYGLYCIIPSTKSLKQTVIFDAHVDTVLNNYRKPELYIQVINSIPRLQISATGLDDRIHCAIMLALAKFVRFEHTSYVLLFSTMEEIGKIGVYNFSKSVNLSKIYPGSLIGRIKKIVVLDVCRGRISPSSDALGISESEEKKNKKLSVVGGGFVSRKNSGKTNYASFIGPYRNIPKILYGVICVNMHLRDSIASVSDAFELYHFLKEFVEPKLLEEEFYEVDEEYMTEEPTEEREKEIKERMKLELDVRKKMKNIEEEGMKKYSKFF